MLDALRLIAQVSDALVPHSFCLKVSPLWSIQTTTFIKQSLTQNNKTSDADGRAKYLPFQTLQTL